MRRSAGYAYSIPAALLLFCWVTMGVTTAYDKDVFTGYGFPLIWYTPSIVSSGGYEIAVGRLIVDLAAYWVVFHLVWLALMKRRTPASTAVARSFQYVLWAAALLSLLVSLAAFSIDPHVTLWQLSPAPPENAPTSHFFSVGLQPRPARPVSYRQ